MAKLKMLQPQLKPISTVRIKVIDQKAGTTKMPGGRAWMETRKRIALAHGYRCAGCGAVWVSYRDQIDHIVPREQGGSNEDSNLQPLCNECHSAKSDGEAKARAGR